MIWSSSNFQRMFPEPITLGPVKDRYFCEMKLFLFKNHIFGPKIKITIIMCSDNVCSIIMWDLIKIDSKLQKLQPFSSIYPKEKLVNYQKLWLLQNVFSYPHRLNPSIVATRKVKWCIFITISISSHHLRVLSIKFSYFPRSLEKFWNNVNIVQVVQNFFWGVYLYLRLLVSVFENEFVSDNTSESVFQFLVRYSCIKSGKLNKIDACYMVEKWRFKMF